MAVKQARKQYKTMQGKMVDMDLLRQRNELLCCWKRWVNARGDELGPVVRLLRNEKMF